MRRQVIAFDITFRDPVTQEELQPKDWTVQVKFNYEDNESLVQAEENEEQEVKVYHLNDIDEEWNKIEELTWTTVEEVVVNEEESEEENVLVIEAESFSVYTIVKQVKDQWPWASENQLANFVYWTISVEDPDHPWQWITIMDRNLWAMTNDITDKKSYWYYYQWWNNYWFNSWWHVVMNTTVDVSSYSFGTYSSDVFYTMWRPKKDLRWDSTNTLIARQWPCPDWWHIPTRDEWNSLIKYWTKGKGYENAYVEYWYTHTAVLSENIDEFINTFQLPAAWSCNS